ncbi:hypothetical protein SprV_0200753200 [Sparganum proliferum]
MAPMATACSSYEPASNTEDYLDAPWIVTLATAEPCPRPEAGPAGRAGDEGDLGADGWTDRRLVISKMHIRLQTRRRPQGKGPSGELNMAFSSLLANHPNFSNETAQRLAKHPVVVVAAAAKNDDEDASVEDRWCHLRNTVESTALAFLSRARHQHQDWFDDNDAAISDLLAEKNRLNKAYIDRPTDDNIAAFYHSRRLVRQRLHEIQNAWTAQKTEGTRTTTNGRTSSTRLRLSTIPRPKALLLFSALTEVPYSLRRHKFCSDDPITSEASLTVLPPSPTPPSPVFLK